MVDGCTNLWVGTGVKQLPGAVEIPKLQKWFHDRFIFSKDET